MVPSILLIEDDPRLSKYLDEALSACGFSITPTASLEEAEAVMAQGRTTDAVILDRMIHGQEGGTLIPKLRALNPSPAIVILSSIDLPSEKARWLELGADDYLGKPFALEELVARVRRAIRVPSDRRTNQLLLGNLVIDSLSHTVIAGGKRVDLTKKEFLLLSLLASHPGRVFNRFQILDRIWHIDSDVETNVVEVAIRNLRMKLNEVAATVRIENRRNVGYWAEA